MRAMLVAARYFNNQAASGGAWSLEESSYLGSDDPLGCSDGRTVRSADVRRRLSRGRSRAKRAGAEGGRISAQRKGF